jgi:CTP synthase (UTP-ammonia lyase)
LLHVINEAKAKSTSASINPGLSIDDSKDAVSARARDNSKKKVRKEKICSFASIIAQLLVETKSSLRESLYNSEFSFKESLRICAKKINEICSDLTKQMHSVNITMKSSIIKELNQNSFTRATV